MGDHIYEINSDKCTECVGHYETPTCRRCPIPNTIVKDPAHVQRRKKNSCGIDYYNDTR